MEWSNVRQLTWCNVLDENGNGTVHTFAYGADGIRCRKNNIYYTRDGERILIEHNADTGRSITYLYGEKGVVGFSYRGSDYYYRKNLFGDVVAIYNTAGEEVATYKYDAWGKNLSCEDEETNEIKRINPIRYRSYYYDVETKFYYLNSRYYDPEIGRFLNADSPDYLGEGNDLNNYNLFAYCENNPVMRVDPTGHYWHVVIGAAIGGAISGIVKSFSNLLEGKSCSDGILVAVLAGAASGALAATSFGITTMIAGNAAISMAENSANQVIQNKGFNNFNVSEMLFDGVIGGLSGAIGGKGNGTKHLTKLGKQTLNRTVDAYINSGFKAGLKEFKKAFAYYGKNSKHFYSAFFKGLLKDFTVAVATSIVSSNYVKNLYLSFFEV